MPASYMAGGIATYGLGMSYQAHPPIYHYAGFDDSTIDPEEKPFTRVRTTGRRSPPKKRALEATPAPEQGTSLDILLCTAAAECIASVNLARPVL